MAEKVFVGIGSNLGDPVSNCEKAINMLSNVRGVEVAKVSSFYRTAPQGVINQNWFINCAVFILTTLPPILLLHEFMSLEITMGRVRTGRWSPRTIDLDILLYGDWVFYNKELILPHPMMHMRKFVLVPMVEIAPYVIHPVFKKNMQVLLRGIGEQEIELIETDSVICKQNLRCLKT